MKGRTTDRPLLNRYFTISTGISDFVDILSLTLPNRSFFRRFWSRVPVMTRSAPMFSACCRTALAVSPSSTSISASYWFSLNMIFAAAIASSALSSQIMGSPAKSESRGSGVRPGSRCKGMALRQLVFRPQPLFSLASVHGHGRRSIVSRAFSTGRSLFSALFAFLFSVKRDYDPVSFKQIDHSFQNGFTVILPVFPTNLTKYKNMNQKPAIRQKTN